MTMMSPMSGEGDFLGKEIEEAPERSERDLKLPPNKSPTIAARDKKLGT